MTLDELKKEYGETNVFENQYGMAQFAHEYAERHNYNNMELKFPLAKMKKDPESFYDLAERLLVKNIAFFNDGYYIIEDLADLASI